MRRGGEVGCELTWCEVLLEDLVDIIRRRSSRVDLGLVVDLKTLVQRSRRHGQLYVDEPGAEREGGELGRSFLGVDASFGT